MDGNYKESRTRCSFERASKEMPLFGAQCGKEEAKYSNSDITLAEEKETREDETRKGRARCEM